MQIYRTVLLLFCEKGFGQITYSKKIGRNTLQKKLTKKKFPGKMLGDIDWWRGDGKSGKKYIS